MTISNQRIAGVLLHISSLPAGDLGQDAYEFIDFLAEAGVSVWQTLPINMTHADGSPYQCLSAHAGNPELIDLQALVNKGWLTQSAVGLAKADALIQAYEGFIKTAKMYAFQQFCVAHASWLEDFALFLSLRTHFNQAGWQDWPEAYKNRHVAALNHYKAAHAVQIEAIKFAQFLFFTQWACLKNYAHQKQVKLFGDIPIFVAYDSAEVWANPHLFKLDADKKMTVVAGVPPDYFSATGQRWGNPHYDWQSMAKDGYAWWVNRMHTQSELFDLVRIDHFRGLEAAWEIDASEETAILGKWVSAPGDELLSAIINALPEIELVAEDLGMITPEVDALRLKFSLPGMKILQFAFGGDETNPYLPENIDENSVAYTGTHDNDTTLGWYRACEPHVKAHLHAYLNHDQPEMPEALVDLVMSTQAKWAIVPMQDLLRLGGEARMNTPGTDEGNWTWRFAWSQLTPDIKRQFANTLQQHGRSSHG